MFSHDGFNAFYSLAVFGSNNTARRRINPICNFFPGIAHNIALNPLKILILS